MILPCNLCLSQRILIQILNNFNVWILIWTSGTYICSELNLGSFEKIMIQNLPYIFHIVVSNGLSNVDEMKDFWNIQGVLPLSRFWKGVVICRTEMIMYKYKMSMFWQICTFVIYALIRSTSQNNNKNSNLYHFLLSTHPCLMRS